MNLTKDIPTGKPCVVAFKSHPNDSILGTIDHQGDLRVDVGRISMDYLTSCTFSNADGHAVPTEGLEHGAQYTVTLQGGHTLQAKYDKKNNALVTGEQYGLTCLLPHEIDFLPDAEAKPMGEFKYSFQKSKQSVLFKI